MLLADLAYVQSPTNEPTDGRGDLLRVGVCRGTPALLATCVINKPSLITANTA